MRLERELLYLKYTKFSIPVNICNQDKIIIWNLFEKYILTS